MSELKGCCQIGNFSITPGICAFDPAAIRRSLAQTRRQGHPCRLGVGINASDSLGQRPPDVRLTLCLPRLIEKLLKMAK